MSEENVALTASEVEAKLLRGPYHQWLGLKVQSVGVGEITLTATWREEWVVNPDIGYTHGGVLAALVDLTADWALVSSTGRGVPTVDLRVDYHRPAGRGDLTAHGKVIKFGGQFSVAEARVLDSDGKLVASGRGVYVTTAPKKA
ncbi:phenylacetic acid degradation protein [Pollutimonas subterranea]|uniref:Phenylacetic acid degradation protein n=1 Tax=Pollutimonas subterranea TaxID=2045210 RepID=A0A2N4U3V1_9BURK|nr:PaaI family thioesterase [Pollutimonas subterranea]PLC49702.1 phenylacetic acid degradation protein [Pollutimonas subterranea]